jgi:hypothetical protein
MEVLPSQVFALSLTVFFAAFEERVVFNVLVLGDVIVRILGLPVFRVVAQRLV